MTAMQYMLSRNFRCVETRCGFKVLDVTPGTVDAAVYELERIGFAFEEFQVDKLNGVIRVLDNYELKVERKESQ